MLLNKIGKILKQERKMLVNTLIVADVCLIILFILLAILGSPYQSWDYSDPEWSVIGTLWHSFEWVYFKVAPLMIIVITAILGIIFVKRNKDGVGTCETRLAKYLKLSTGYMGLLFCSIFVYIHNFS